MAGPSRWLCNEAAQSVGWCVGCSGVVSQHGYWLLTVGWGPGWVDLLVQHELVLDVNEKEALKCHCCTSLGLSLCWLSVQTQQTKDMGKKPWPPVHIAVYLPFAEGKDSSTSSQGQQSLNIWRATVLRNTVSGFRAGLQGFRVYSAQIGFGSWFSNISCHCNRRKIQQFYRLKIQELKMFSLLKHVPKYLHIWLH